LGTWLRGPTGASRLAACLSRSSDMFIMEDEGISDEKKVVEEL
jgi:hypothetical protein